MDRRKQRPGAKEQAAHLGGAMKLLRARRRLSQSALAEKMGKSATNVARMETDQNPTLNTLSEALDAMGFGFDDLARAMMVEAGVLPDFDYEEGASAQDRAVIKALVAQVATLEEELRGRKTQRLAAVRD